MIIIKTRWYKDRVFYQIYPRSFCDSNNDGIGDIKGIISKLNYLEELGIKGIWLSPIYESPNHDMGYDIQDYLTISSDYGTMEDFELLIQELKKRDIKLIMDLVVNHTSNEHMWFKEAQKSLDNPYRNYYIWKKGKGKNGQKPPNNWTSRFLGYAWTKSEPTNEWYLHLFTNKQPDLNWENPKVREEIKNICNFWFEKGIDGFRCDVITYIAKNPHFTDGKYRFLHIGDEHFVMYGPWHKYIKYLYNESWGNYDSYIIAEGAGASYKKVLKATKEENHEFDSFITFDHMEVDFLLGFIKTKKINLPKLKECYNRWQALPSDNWHTLYNENHDQPRSVSRYIRNKKYHKIGAKMLITSMMFQKGTPFVYEGQEIGMTNYHFRLDDFNDILSKMLKRMLSVSIIGRRIYKKFMPYRARDNARTPMQWDNTRYAGFSNKKPWYKVNPNKRRINVMNSLYDSTSILNYYKEIIRFRTNNEIIKNGSYEDLLPKHKNLYVYKREYQNMIYLVCSNYRDKNIKFDLTNEMNFVNGEILFSNYGYKGLRKPLKDILLPYETRVYIFKKISFKYKYYGYKLKDA